MENQIDESVKQLRNRFGTEYELNRRLFHSFDLKKVKGNDWPIRRFIARKDEEAYQKMIEALKWRKKYCINDVTDDFFPKEFYQLLSHEKFSRDKKGRLVAWNIENRFQRYESKLIHLSPMIIQQFYGFQMEKLDKEADEKGWVIVNDYANAGHINIDRELVIERYEQMEHYPARPKHIINVDMPYILQECLDAFKKGTDSMEFVSREELTKFIDPEEIPSCFGGLRPCCVDEFKDFRTLLGCQWYLSLTDQQVDHFYDTYKQYFPRPEPIKEESDEDDDNDDNEGGGAKGSAKMLKELLDKFNTKDDQEGEDKKDSQDKKDGKESGEDKKDGKGEEIVEECGANGKYWKLLKDRKLSHSDNELVAEDKAKVKNRINSLSDTFEQVGLYSH